MTETSTDVLPEDCVVSTISMCVLKCFLLMHPWCPGDTSPVSPTVRQPPFEDAGCSGRTRSLALARAALTVR